MCAELIKILLVEDDPGDIFWIKEMLEEERGASYEFQIEHYDCLSKAIEYLANEKPDAVLLDLMLPDSQGIQTLTSMIAMAPELPIVVLTIISEEQFGIEALRKGAQDYWVKGQVNFNLLVGRSLRYAIERKRTEGVLRLHEEMLEGIVNSVTDHMSMIDQDHNIVWVNEVAKRSFGPDLVGKKCYRAYHQREEPCESCVVRKVFQDGQIHEHETEAMLADGRTGRFWCTASVARRDPDGRPQMVIEISRDITGRLQAEEALRQASVKLQDLVQEYGRRNLEISLINKMSALLQSCLSCREAYPIIVRYTQEAFPGMSGALFLLNPDKNVVEAVSSWGESLSGELVFAPKDCWALRRSAIHVSSQEMRCRHVPGTLEGNYICIPLTALGEALGMVHLQGSGELSEKLTESNKRLALALANHIALSLANLKLRETLGYQAIHDPLTGLFNRRYLEETLEREIHRVRRKGASLGVMMLDLDHFKRFNDTFGHEAGDNLLRALGNFLKTQVRQEDIACRYGGEEFLLVLPETSLEVAQQRAERFRQGVSRLQVYHLGQLLENITVSLGVAIFPEHGATGEDLIRAADDAMYIAKAQGRNRVVVAGQQDASLN